MKVRNGFVSNSSSSSFIISILKDGACPSCGLSIDMLFDIINEAEDSWVSDESWYQEELEELEDELKQCDEDIARGAPEADDRYSRSRYSSDRAYVDAMRHHRQCTLDQIEVMKRWKLDDGPRGRGRGRGDDNVMRVNVSHHEHALSCMLRAFERLGIIKVLESSD